MGGPAPQRRRRENRGSRFGSGRGSREYGTDLRSVLHDEGTRSGHWAWLGDRVTHRRQSARNRLGRPRARGRCRIPPAFPGCSMKILVIDDELGLRQTLSLILADEGHDVAVAPNGAAGLVAAEQDPPDLVLCDVRMPEMDGFGFLDRYTSSGGRALVIMMSAYGDDDATLEAIRRGAYDFIAKPFRADQVMLIVRKAIEREGLRHQVEQLTDALTMLRGPSELVGRSSAIRQVITLANKVAPHPSTVLVTGESGTGKELVARLVHSASLRANGAFVAVNCGAIPEALLESELFGHVRGAFTGAENERRGLFEEASAGTLFLDEIGELPQQLQVKLLRALQEGEVRPVGDNQSRTVDVRLVAATSRDLEAEV